MKSSTLIVASSLALATCVHGPDIPATPARAWVTPAVEAPHLHYRTFHSRAVGTAVSYHIYLPDAYAEHPQQRFPVSYWLHGSGGGLRGLPTLVEHFDHAIRTGKMPPMLVVFPDGNRTMWCNDKDGRVPMETVFIEDLIPDVDASFRTRANRRGRLIEGFSMGGYGAARMGFKYPELFAAVSMLAPGPMQPDFLAVGPRSNLQVRQRILDKVYGGDPDYFKAQSPWMLAEQHAETLRNIRMPMRLLIGELDETVDISRAFVSHLESLGLSLTFKVFSAIGHDPRALLAAFGRDEWQFYVDTMKK